MPTDTPAADLIVTEFPVTLDTGTAFVFTYEGATYRATANWPHVFHEAHALADHLSRTARGLYDGLNLLPASAE